MFIASKYIPRLLASESTADTLDVTGNSVVWHTKHFGHSMLSVSWALRGRVHLHLALLRLGIADTALTLDIEVLLSTHVHSAFKDVCCTGKACTNVTLGD